VNLASSEEANRSNPIRVHVEAPMLKQTEGCVVSDIGKKTDEAGRAFIG